MNKKEKLFHDIESKLDTFHFQIKKMQKPGFNVHAIDVDLLKKKTIDLYDKLNELEFDLSEKRANKTINLPERMPKAEIPEKSSMPIIEREEEKVEVESLKEEIKIDPAKEETKPELKTEVTKEKTIEKETVVSTVVKERPEPEKVIKEMPTEPVEAHKHVESEPQQQTTSDENKDSTQSAFDLFSADGEATVGDKFGSSDEPSIADRMQKSQVIDLRQAIGINEKFLFINELFNGDMARYNKAIDELNELKTQQGVNTYLLELKVANQWLDDNETFLKFKNLLERKFI